MHFSAATKDCFVMVGTPRAAIELTSCLHHGGTKLTQIMVPHSLNGLAGISRGVEISLLDL